MKILIDARLYGLEHAGPGRYVKNLVDELAKIDKKNIYILLLRKKYFKKLKTPQNWKKILCDYRHFTVTEQVRLILDIKNQKPDLVHFPFVNVPIFYFGKFIVTLHDMTMHKFKGGKATTRGALRNSVWRMGYHLSFFKAVWWSTKIIVPSKAVRSELSKYYKIDESKITITYEGVTKVKLGGGNVKKKYGIENKYFIYSGSAYPHKNLKRAIEAIKLLNQKTNEKITFVITSSRNVFTQRIKRWIENIEAKKYVKMIGFVPDKDLMALFAGSIAFVYPTLSEGFGLPVLEAMSAGTIGISSEIPVLKEIYSDKVLYFNPRNTTSIKESMEKVIRMDKKKRNRRIEEGQKYVKKYSWEKMAKETLLLYEEI